MTEPQNILERYAKSGSSADFEEIVKSYGALVFGTAFRSIGCRALAEEIMQDVFITLARKHRTIKESHKLSSWLHRTTLLCSANMNRKEASRRNAMKRYTDESDREHFSPKEGEAWENALPFLDSAIDRLPASDREAVMLRFYDHSSYREIGEKIGKSEEACRKKIVRALEKLTSYLRKDDVTVSPSILVIGLDLNLTKDVSVTAPDKIAWLATTAPKSAGVSSLTTKIIAMSGYKSAIAAASIAALIPIGMQGWRNYNSPESFRDFQESRSWDSRSERRRDLTTLPRTERELIVEIEEALEIKNPHRRHVAIEHLMFELKSSELRTALAALHFLEETHGSRTINSLAYKLFVRWGISAPEEALKVINDDGNSSFREQALNGLVQSWAYDDPLAVDSYLESLSPGDLKDQLSRSRWHNHARRNPIDAANMALQIEDPGRQAIILSNIIQQNFNQGNVDQILDGIAWLEEMDDGTNKEEWFGQLIETLSGTRPELAFFKSMELLKGSPQKSSLRTVMGEWAKVDPVSAFENLLSLSSEIRGAELTEAFAEGLADLDLANEFLNRLEEEEDKNAFVAGMAKGLTEQENGLRNLTPSGIDRVRKLVEPLPAGEDRSYALWNLAKAWSALDHQGAIEWFRNQPGVDEQRIKRFKRIFGQ